MEADNSPPHLHSVISMFQQRQSFSHQYQGPKLGIIIIKKELTLLYSKDSMKPWNWDVIDSNIDLMSSSDFDKVFLGKVNDMETSDGVFVFIEDFEDQIGGGGVGEVESVVFFGEEGDRF